MGTDVIRAGRAINSRRRPSRVANVSAAAVALALAIALTLLEESEPYGGADQAKS